MMKKIVTISLFVFMAGLAGILIAGYLVSQQQEKSLTTGNNSGQAASQPAVSDFSKATTTAETALSASEVAKHSDAKDCWQIINGKVYDVTSYIDKHPGGVETIIALCGKEATAAFSTKGEQGSNHSDFAWKLLDKYYVGPLGQ